jgi:hypothetical protein
MSMKLSTKPNYSQLSMSLGLNLKIMSADPQDSQLEVQTLVVTGSFKEYLEWRQKNAGVRLCKYVEGVEDIQGLNGFFVNLIFHGNYLDNPAYATPQMQKLIIESRSPFRSYVKTSLKLSKKKKASL